MPPKTSGRGKPPNGAKRRPLNRCHSCFLLTVLVAVKPSFLVWSEGNDLYPVGEQQGCRHSRNGLQATGRTAGFKKTEINVLSPCDGQHHEGPSDKLRGQVVAVSIDNPGHRRENGMAIAIDQSGRRAWGRQAPQLFGADRYPVIGAQLLQAGRTPFALSIVSSTQSGETGADQTFFWGHGSRLRSVQSGGIE